MYPDNYQPDYADFFKRFAAYIIDGIIFSVASTLLFFVMGYFIFFPLLFSGWLYYALMESSKYQATLGKMALGLIVADMNGGPVSFGKATGRYFGKCISHFLYIGFIMAAFTERKQALHDLMAGTFVLNAAPGRNTSMDSGNYTPAPRRGFGGTPVLYGITGEFSGRSIQVDQRGLTLGRDSSFCQVAFSGNAPGISRRHCTLNFNHGAGTFTLVDVGSSYGTFLESGMKVMQGQAIALKPGDRFYVGNRNNMFEVRL